MFRKLLKYDLKYVWRIWWIMAVSVLGLSVVGSAVLRYVITSMMADDVTFFTIMSFFFLFICFMAIIFSLVFTEIMIFVRFYKHFFTDEGYLTFTLPVSRKSLLMSKTLSGLIWIWANVILIVICVMIFMLISPPAEAGKFFINPVAYKWLGGVIANAWSAVGAWLIVYVVIAIVLISLMFLFTLSMIQFCITIGAIIAKKLKVLAAIGIYYLINMGISFVVTFFGGIGTGMLIDGFAYKMAQVSTNQACFIVALLLIVICAIVAAVACIFECATIGKLERKLNLA